MTAARNSASKSSAELAATGSVARTIRIEHDRKRLALAAVASALAMLVLPGMLIVSSLQPSRGAPAWTLAPLGVAMIVAALGFLRSIVRLQDGDPALVVSPRGLDFRPYLFGEIARIPWKAIRGLKSRRYKQNRFLVVQVDNLDRYAPRAGILRFLRRIGKRRLGNDEISFSTPMAKPAWHDLEITLQRYLAQYGRPAATNESVHKSNVRGNTVGTVSRVTQSRSVP